MHIGTVKLADTVFVKRMTMAGLGLAGLGIVLSVLSAFGDWDRFLFGYLIGFVFFAGVAITGVFFSMLQYLVRAGWSVSIRRIPEFMGAFVPFLLVLMVPVALGVGTLYHHWVHPEHGDVIMAGKKAWLNTPFFLARLGAYYLIWLALYYVIVGNSYRQDTTTDLKYTERNWKLSAPGMIVFGVTITFAAFDVIMSLSPHWYSTIYGVYYFAGSLVATLAMLCIIAVALRRAGLLTEWLTPARFHDLGKLLFAFNVFWAYIAFSQYLLIWYANIPEEVVFFKARFENGWQYVSYTIVFAHFFVPFIILLSQEAKKNLNVLLTGAVILLLSHFIDVYWLIMPNHSPEAVVFGWQELAPWLGIGGLFLLVVAWQFRRRNAIPVNDPFLAEGAH
ncbi:MAG: hypothetical protein HY962_17025 [Ignavibacteriae bacterium]|nr:hypothetical protein [Ignavibacteriota bacterium]